MLMGLHTVSTSSYDVEFVERSNISLCIKFSFFLYFIITGGSARRLRVELS